MCDAWHLISNGDLPKTHDWYLAVFRESDTGFICVPYVAEFVGTVQPWTTRDGWIIHEVNPQDYSIYYHMLECVAWVELPEWSDSYVNI